MHYPTAVLAGCGLHKSMFSTRVPRILRVESSWQTQRVTARAEALSRLIIISVDSG